MSLTDLGKEHGYSETKNPLLRKIQRDWDLVNFGAETASPVFDPFGTEDVSPTPLSPDKYIPRKAPLEATLLGLRLEPNIRGKLFLNVGAGASKLGAELRKLGAKVIDLDPGYIKTAPHRSSEPVVAPGEKLPFPDNHFDEVLLSFVLCVVAEPRAVLNEALRVAKNARGTLRIYPVVSFIDLTKTEHPGMDILRRGMDEFTFVIHKEPAGDNLRELQNLLFDPDKIVLKPTEDFWRRRLRGYYYDKEHDALPLDQRWQGSIDPKTDPFLSPKYRPSPH